MELAQPQDKHIAMTPWLIDSLQFGQFLDAVFDIWIREDIGDIGINYLNGPLAAGAACRRFAFCSPPAAARLR